MGSSADSNEALVRSNLRTCFLRLVLVIGSTTVALCAAEVCVRALGLEVPPRPGAPKGKGLRFVKGPSGDRRHAPGVYHQSYRLHRDDEPRVTTITIDRRGFRNGVPAANDGGEKRLIACLGDSYTFGYGVDDDETWPFQLREALNSAAGSPVFETLNAGINGMNTAQEATYLKERVMRVSPELVLLAFYLNDAAIGANALGSEHELKKPPPLYEFVNRNPTFVGLRERSRLADLIGDRLVKSEYLEFLGTSRTQLYREDRPGWKKCRKELLRIRDMCARRGTRFAVVFYPLLFRQGDVLATHDAYQTVADYLDTIEVPHFDLEPEFLKHDVDQLRVHPLDAHLNGEAHGIAARAIARWLTETQRSLMEDGSEVPRDVAGPG